MDGYIAAKKLIYRNATDQDTLVVNVDDLPCLTIYETLKNTGKMNLLPFSVCKVLSDGIYVKDGTLYEKGHSIVNLNSLDRLKGVHNWQNVAAAYGALRSVGLDSAVIVQGIKSFPGLAHRQE